MKETDKARLMIPVTKWANQCEFTCKACNEFTHIIESTFSIHVATIHKMNMSQYRLKYGPPMTVRAIQKCALCKTELTLRRGIFTTHMKNCHNLKLDAYFDKYVKGKKLPVKKIKLNKRIIREENLSKQARDWICKFKYECKECNEHSSVYKRDFKAHIKKMHHMKPSDYYQKHGEIDGIQKHKCQICKRLVTWEWTSLTKHLKRTHDLSAPEYYSKYIIIKDDKSLNEKSFTASTEELQHAALETEARKWVHSKNRSKCKLCNDFESPRQQTFRQHLEKAHGISHDEYLQIHGKSCKTNDKHQCKICYRFITWELVCLHLHLKSYHTMTIANYYGNFIKNTSGENPSITSDTNLYDQQLKANKWASKITYRCKECDNFEDKSKGMFRRHIWKTHNMKSIQYYSKHGHHHVDGQKHTCLLCGAALSWNYDSMYLHFRESHGLTIVAYYKKYIEDGGQEESAMVPFKGEDIVDQKHKARIWATKYWFECQECHTFQCRSESRMRLHLGKQHNMDLCQYYTKHGNPKKEGHFKCKICNAQMAWNSSLLRSHIRTHKLSIEEYYSIYIDDLVTENVQELTKTQVPGSKFKGKTNNDTSPAPNKIQSNEMDPCSSETSKESKKDSSLKTLHDCKNACKKCKTPGALYKKKGCNSSKESYKTNEQKKVDKEKSILSDDDESFFAGAGEKSPYTSQSEDGYSLHDTDDDLSFFSDSTSEQEETTPPFSEAVTHDMSCEYSCKLCKNNAKFEERHSFDAHISTSHNMTFSQYTTSIASPFLHFSLQSCPHCSRVLVGDMDVIQQHYKEAHKGLDIPGRST